MKKGIYALLFVSVFILGFLNGGGKNTFNKITANDNYNYIDVNNCKMWVSNNGDGSHNPQTDISGFYWPGGEDTIATTIFEDGLIWGGIVNGEIRANGNTWRYGLQAGKILEDGIADSPNKERYRVYKINNNWKNFPPGPKRDAYEKDYNEWPAEDGAPWNDINGDGIFTRGIDEPQFIGDETLWYVSNDLDTTRSTFTYGSLPIGLEFQTTVFGFNTDNFVKNALFKKYKIINKSADTVKSMYLGYWSDASIGRGWDDLVGCDSLLNMQFVYNGMSSEDDSYQYYGLQPPAQGYVLLQGPKVKSSLNEKAKFDWNWIKGYKNLPMTSFIFIINNNANYPDYTDAWVGCYEGTIMLYNQLQGNLWNGDPIIDPHTSLETKFPLSGDPVNKTGWYHNDSLSQYYSGSRRIILSTGPFDFAPGDTQEVVIGFLVSQGSNYLQSLVELKKDAKMLPVFYNNYRPESPKTIITLPKFYRLRQNYPNPFNPNTTIEYSLPFEQFVTIKVFNILGKKVKTLVNKIQPARKYQIQFDGSGLPSGVYIYRIEAGSFSQSKKMILLR